MKYRKKPVVVDAFQYDGELTGSDGEYYVPDWAADAFEKDIIYHKTENIFEGPWEMYIRTLEGDHHISVGDYIIRGVKGELYPCKPDIFELTYEPVEDKSDDCE
jgi:hypothetical protein